MNTQKKLLLLFFGLLLTFLLPNYAWATLSTDIPSGAKTHSGTRVNICYKKADGKFVTMNISTGRLKSQRLHDGDEYLVSGKCGTVTPTLQCPSDKIYNKTSNSCVTPATGNVDAPTILDNNGALLDFSPDSGTYPTLLSGTDKAVGAVYEYKNVVTIAGVQVDALVKIDKAVNAAVDTIDDPAPNGGNSYTVSSGNAVPDKSVFGPRVKATAANGYVDFLIVFQDTSGNPITLNNVYNNSIDIDGPEFVEYGGFVSYALASTTDLTAAVGSDGIKRKFTGKGNYNGLILNDIGRVQTKFNSMSTLVISMGATSVTSSNALANIDGRASYGRQYGSIFVQHNIPTPVEQTPPTVNSQITSNTKPPITGGKGSSTTVSIIVKDSTGVTKASGNATVSGTTWTFTPATALLAGVYDVVATGSNGLVDQTDDELTILLTCTLPNVINAAGTACEPKAVCDPNEELDESTNTCVTPTSLRPSVDLGQTATDYAVPVLTGSVFGTSTSLTITAKHSTTNTIYPVGTATKTASNGWTVTGTTKLPAGTYDVIATGDTGLVDNTTGELVVSTSVIPTVDNKTTTDKVAVPLTGTAGTSSTLIITVKNSSNTVVATSSTITPVSNNWTYTPPVLPAGTYNVVATGDAAHGSLVDTTSGELVVLASIIPTVDNKTTIDTVAVPLTGTVGTSTSLQIQVKNASNAIVDSGTATIIGTGWSFLPKVLPAGTYNVMATGDAAHGSLVDTTSGELVISASVIPTVDKKTTTEKVAVPLTGSIGSSASLIITVKDSTGITKATGTATLSGTTWTYTPIVLPAGTYEVIATGDAAHGSLIDDTKDELVVTAITPPTVESQTTFDTTPVIKGTVGALALETGEAFTVSVNGKTYTKGIDANLVVSGTGWTLTILAGNEIPGKATPYDVVATRGTAPDAKTGTGQLTITPCALPKVVNAAKTACIDPVPTVVKQTINSNTAVAPVITGTVGEVALGSTETFSVTIKTTTPQVYAHATPETELKVTGTNWTLTVPSNKAISAGTYDVDAARNTSAKDATSGELVINLVCNTDETNVNGVCAPKAYSPTVETLITDDTTPVITGTVGTSVLAAGETFTVTVNGVLYPHPTVTGLEWSVQIPIENALNVGAYPVEATRGDLTGKGTVTITQCASPKVVNATTGDCSDLSHVPTVEKVDGQTVTGLAPVSTNDRTPVITGSVGSQTLGSDTFSITLTNQTSHLAQTFSASSFSGTTWTLNVGSDLALGIYEIDAERTHNNVVKHDATTLEMEVTGNLCCISGVTTQCPTTIAIPNYTGECSIPVCPNTDAAGNCTSPHPDPKKEETLPSQPTSKVEEAIKPPADLGYCDDGGKRSYGESMSGITIKRARIANAETIGGTFESNALVGMHVMYGTLTAGSYEDNDHSCEQGYCVNKTITGATLTGAFVDIANDYVNAAGAVIDNSNRGIALTGGVTNPTSFRKDGVTPINATITNGMITAGTDGAGNPVRGSITNGLFADPITHVSSVLTKGRRTQGTLTNATISGATITTVNGVSVVGCDRSLDSTHTPCTVGVIVNGTMDSTGVKTFGTVENATLTGATILNSNHCFSSGTVGSKGQLNWKEVVK